jgi:hypothetical protein
LIATAVDMQTSVELQQFKWIAAPLSLCRDEKLGRCRSVNAPT